MPPSPAMVVRVAANIEELRRNLKEGRDEITVTTAGMQKLANSFSGERLIQGAHNVVAAVKEIGGVSKLTEAEQARVNATLDRAIEKYKALGQTAPAAMIELHKQTQSAETSLRSLDQFGVQSINNVGGAAQGTTGKVGGLRGEFQKFDGVLQSVGINIGPQVKGLDDIASVAGKTTSQVGLLGTAGLALGVGFAGWGLGRMIAEFTGLDKIVEKTWRSLLNYADAGAQAAAAKQDTLNRAIAQGAPATISYTDAIEFNAKALQKNIDSKINWTTILAAAQREVRNLTDAQIREIEIAQKAGATTEQITNKYNISALALQQLAERQRAAAKAAEEHQREIERLDKAYAKLMSDVKNANQLAIMEEEAAFRKQVAEQEAFFAEQEIQVRLRRQQAARDQQAAEAAAEEARIAANQREIDALLATTQVTKDAGVVSKQTSDQMIAGYAGVATQIQITGEAMREWLELMRYTASVNAILSSGSSLFTTQSQRERIAALPTPRAMGGPVDAGRPYTVGERGPELFVPSQHGTIVPNGAGGGMTVVVQIAPGAVQQNFPIGGSDPVARQMLTQELGDVFIESLKQNGVL